MQQIVWAAAGGGVVLAMAVELLGLWYAHRIGLFGADMKMPDPEVFPR